MTEYHHLIGAEDVRAGGQQIRLAAAEMERAASNIDMSLQRFLQQFGELVNRLEAAATAPDIGAIDYGVRVRYVDQVEPRLCTDSWHGKNCPTCNDHGPLE